MQKSASRVCGSGRISRSHLTLKILYRAELIVEDTGKDRSYTVIRKFSTIWIYLVLSGNDGLVISSLNDLIHASHHRHLLMLKKLEVPSLIFAISNVSAPPASLNCGSRAAIFFRLASFLASQIRTVV